MHISVLNTHIPGPVIPDNTTRRPATRSFVIKNRLNLQKPGSFGKRTAPISPGSSLTLLPVSDSDSTSSDSSDLSSSLLYSYNTMPLVVSSAIVTRHAAHKIPPVLGDGVVTPACLQEWENACADFFDAAKEPIAEDKKVAKITGGFQNNNIRNWFASARTRIHALTFTDLMDELRETFLPLNWEQDTKKEVLTTCMTDNQSFFDFSTKMIWLNDLLLGKPAHLDETRLHEVIYYNMSNDLHEDCEKSDTELAAMQALSLPKWQNTISERDLKLKKTAMRLAERVAAQVEKEGKKRVLADSSRAANATNNNEKQFKVEGSRKLTQEERDIIREHRGCFKCCRLYAGHFQMDCNNLPVSFDAITQDTARCAKAEFDKKRARTSSANTQNNAQSTLRTQANANRSTPAAAVAASTENADESGEESENSQTVAVTRPSAVIMGSDDDDSDLSEEVCPLVVPHYFWRAKVFAGNDIPIAMKCLIDDGAHVVMIRPDIVE